MSKKTDIQTPGEDEKKTADQAVSDTPAEETETEKKAEPEKQENKAPEKTAEESLKEELAKQKDAYLRLAAEYDNYRKRTAKEKEDSFNNAKATVFEDLLPVLDNFTRALATEEASLADFKKGVEMTYTQFKDFLRKYDVEEFAEPGDSFDPNFHNAVMHVEDESLPENTVAEVFQKGYKIKEKILRPAMVKVSN